MYGVLFVKEKLQKHTDQAIRLIVTLSLCWAKWLVELQMPKNTFKSELSRAKTWRARETFCFFQISLPTSSAQSPQKLEHITTATNLSSQQSVRQRLRKYKEQECLQLFVKATLVKKERRCKTDSNDQRFLLNCNDDPTNKKMTCVFNYLDGEVDTSGNGMSKFGGSSIIYTLKWCCGSWNDSIRLLFQGQALCISEVRSLWWWFSSPVRRFIWKQWKDQDIVWLWLVVVSSEYRKKSLDQNWCQ